MPNRQTPGFTPIAIFAISTSACQPALHTAAGNGAPALSVESETGPSNNELDDAVLQRLDAVFGTSAGKAPATSEATADQRYRAFIQSRMQDDAFYDTVIPKLFVSMSSGIVRRRVLPLTLKQAVVDGTTIHYIDRPCTLADTKKVTPWWDLTSEVQVCADAYAPDVVADERSGQTQHCEAIALRNIGGSVCRCGPLLMNCARDDEQQDLLLRAARDELVKTTQHVVQHRRPLGDILTINESVRSEYAEFIYARSRYFRTGDFRLGPLTTKPVLRPREPAYSSGVLTTPAHLWLIDDARRVVLSFQYADFLCTPFISANVHAQQMFEIEPNASKSASATLRTAEHMQLTKMTGCSNCHVRLEYGVRAFRLFSSSRYGMRLVDTDARIPNTMDFFVFGDEAPRASGPATTEFVGSTIRSQPEFSDCIVSHVEELVYAGHPVPQDVHARLMRSFATQDLAALMEEAVVARFADKKVIH